MMAYSQIARKMKYTVNTVKGTIVIDISFYFNHWISQCYHSTEIIKLSEQKRQEFISWKNLLVDKA